MKKLLPFILCLLLVGSVNAGQRRVLSPFLLPACVKDTVTLVMDQDTTDSNEGTHGTNAQGQSVSIGGGSWQLYSLAPFMGAGSSGCEVTIRIGSTANLSTYDEEWTGVAMAAGDYTEVTSSLHTTYTTAYIGMIETDGTCYWDRSTSNLYANGARYSYVDATGWSMTNPLSTDFRMKVWKTTVICE